MKNVLFALFALSVGLSLNANAITIDLFTSQTALTIGDNIEVQVRISGLNGTPTLGVYDVDFNYDASLFNLDGINWGDTLLGNQLNLHGFGSLQESSSASGWLNALELSFDDALALESLQAGEFTLFSVLLTAIAIGNGDFSLTANAIGDAYGNNLGIDSINSAQINVGGISVPEPSSLLLLLGMLAVIALRAEMPRSQK